MVYINVGHSCNNRCDFCVSGEWQQGDLTKNEILDFLHKALKKDRRLLLCGGEPTCRDDIESIVSFATKKYKAEVSLVSNVRRFSDLNFVKKMEKVGLKFVYASLYGYSHDLHESLTNIPGSYSETIKGIKNLINSKIGLEIRILVNKRTYTLLHHFIHFLMKLFEGKPAVPSICFIGFEIDGLAVKNKEKYACRYSEIRPYLQKAFELGSRLGLKVEGENFPLCVVENKFRQFLRQFPEVRSFYFMKSYLAYGHLEWQLNDDKFSYLKKCSLCLLRSVCGGFIKTHVKYFGEDEIHPISSQF